MRDLVLVTVQWTRIDFHSDHTRAKIRARLFKTHAVFGRAYFRKMLIFEPCLFKISMNLKALFFKIYHTFWLNSMYSRSVYGSNIPLKYTGLLWYLQFYLKNFGTQRSAIWERLGCLLFQASRALALMRILFSMRYRKEMR